MAVKLYADHKNGKTFILSNNIEDDASKADLTINEYIREIKRLNPQFSKVYTI